MAVILVLMDGPTTGGEPRLLVVSIGRMRPGTNVCLLTSYLDDGRVLLALAA